jgi:hypothetical protein
MPGLDKDKIVSALTGGLVINPVYHCFALRTWVRWLPSESLVAWVSPSPSDDRGLKQIPPNYLQIGKIAATPLTATLLDLVTPQTNCQGRSLLAFWVGEQAAMVL